MSLQGRSPLQQQFELSLERQNPRKVQLLRALPPNCTSCIVNGRKSINQNCETCVGTGYLGISLDPTGNFPIVTATGARYVDTAPPAVTVYLIYGDVQMGHGLLGNGGNYIKLMSDIGRQEVGDATFYCKLYDRDYTTGQIVYPSVDPNLFRPDRIISKYGTTYNVVEEIVYDFGADTFCRAFTLSQGSYTNLRGAK